MSMQGSNAARVLEPEVTRDETVYPESDDKPMAETQDHVDAIFDAYGELDEHHLSRPDVLGL